MKDLKQKNHVNLIGRKMHKIAKKKWKARPVWIGGLLGVFILCAVIVWLAWNPSSGADGSSLIGSNKGETMASDILTEESPGGLPEPGLATETETGVQEGTGQLDENAADNSAGTTADGNPAQNTETGSGAGAVNGDGNFSGIGGAHQGGAGGSNGGGSDGSGPGNGANGSDNAGQGVASGSGGNSPVQSGSQTAGSSGTATTTGQNSPTQPSAGSGTKQAPVMSDAEFAKVRETIDSYGAIAAKTAGMKISPMMLQLSGLGPDVDEMKEAQASLDRRIDEFNSIAGGIKAPDIQGKSREEVLTLNSDIARLNTSLDKKLNDLKTAKKAADVEKVGTLLKEISGNFGAVSANVEKLNAVLSRL